MICISRLNAWGLRAALTYGTRAPSSAVGCFVIFALSVSFSSAVGGFVFFRAGGLSFSWPLSVFLFLVPFFLFFVPIAFYFLLRQ